MMKLIQSIILSSELQQRKYINIHRGMLLEVCQANCSYVGNVLAVTATEVVEFPGDGFHTSVSEVEVALHNH